MMPLAEQRGGSEVMLRQLVEHRGAGGTTWLVIFLEHGPMVAGLERLGVEVAVVEAGRLREPHRHAAAIARIAFVAHRWRADVLVGWMVKSQLYAAPAALLAGIPAVWYQLGAPYAPGWLDRVATALPASGILAVSQSSAEAQAQIRPRRALRVVRPGIELHRFDPSRLPSPREVRARLGLPARGPLIGIVGRLQRWKGIHVLIEAMPQIQAVDPRAHCVVVGGAHALEPGYPGQLEQRIAALDLAGSVTLSGLQPDVAEWMQAMDVVVHASDREPFGLVILEAMALGKPVVAGAEGGPAEIVHDGIDGLLAPFGDSDALARAVLRYLGDPGFATTAGEAARTRAADFGVERFAAELTNAVTELAQRPRRARAQ